MKIYLFLIGCLINVSVFSQDLLPNSKGEIVKHTMYTLSYNEAHEQANWVYYHLTKDMMSGGVSRKDDFRADPEVSTYSASLDDYKGSGYDRGHLAPAADMKFNELTMSESFYLSNMSPQAGGLNRGKWKSLEEQVRTWCFNKGSLNVVTGGVFKDNLGTIGKNAVTIPGYYYKIIYCEDQSCMIGFVMPNRKLDKDLFDYVVSVDAIEEMTDIDFFPQLEDDLENKLESNVLIDDWRLKSNAHKRHVNHKNKLVKKIYSSTQCNGIAKSTGMRCKQKTSSSSGYCRYHQ